MKFSLYIRCEDGYGWDVHSGRLSQEEEKFFLKGSVSWAGPDGEEAEYGPAPRPWNESFDSFQEFVDFVRGLGQEMAP